MSGSRVPSARRKTSRKASVVAQSKPKVHRFIGISLSGGKSDKACISVVEYFPQHKKVFLARMFERIKNEELLSADSKIHEIVSQFSDEVEYIAFDAPLTLPPCFTPTHKCPGAETCNLPEVKWMRDFYQEVNKRKRPKRTFTSYTQRAVEAYVTYGLEENFEIQHALGSNMAPLTARAQYISRRLQDSQIEVFPRLSIWRIGQDLKVAKSHLKYHKHAVGGDESRRVFLQALSDKRGVFIYQQDMKVMVENNHAFESFVCAYTGFLKFMNQTEPRPSNFPKAAGWIEFPKA